MFPRYSGHIWLRSAICLLPLACSGGPEEPLHPELAGTAAATVAKVVITPKRDTINALGDTIALTAVAYNSAGAPLPGTKITWTSLTATRVKVSTSGKAWSVGVGGSAKIKAVAGSKADTATILSRQVLASLTITPGAQTLTQGHTQQETAAAVDSNNVAIVGAGFSWTSSAPAVAAVSAGLVLASTPGTTDITANSSVGAVSATITVVAPPDTAPLSTPNVVIILTDDERWDGMQYLPLASAFFASETVKFDNAFTSTPICCPSRSSLLTGLHVHNHGVRQNYQPLGGATLLHDASTLATWLHDAGYRTGLFGKYLNDYDLLSPYIPPGWDDWHAFVAPDNNFFYNYTINDNGVIKSHGSLSQDYSTNVIAGDATQFIQSTPAGQPLFLYFSTAAPHRPFTPGPGDAGTFAGLPNWRPAAFNEADVSDKPSWIRGLPLLTPSKIATEDANHRLQLESLQAVDRGMASIVDALGTAGRLDQTIFIFASDNGFAWGEHRLGRGKECVYEECMRAPIWIRVPGMAGRHDPSLVELLDLAPTIAEWAGTAPPSPVNGVSLKSLITDPATPWRSELLFEYFGNDTTTALNQRFTAVRTSQYKYAEYENGETEFYDLLADPYEMQNSVTDPAYAAIVAQLKALLDLLRNS